jgi:hypothetical protein
LEQKGVDIPFVPGSDMKGIVLPLDANDFSKFYTTRDIWPPTSELN